MTYAIKVNFENDQLTDYKRDIVLNEMKAIQKIQDHPNIIKLINVIEHGYIQFRDKQDIQNVFAILVLEVLTGGELFYHIKRCGRFSIETCLFYFK